MQKPVLVLLLLLAACASSGSPAECSGPAVSINARWQPSQAQQATMDRIIKEACS